MLLAFGLAMIVCGLVYRTPMPVQPQNDGAELVDRWRSLARHILLLTNRIVPAMFLLLLFGAAYGFLSDPTPCSLLCARSTLSYACRSRRHSRSWPAS